MLNLKGAHRAPAGFFSLTPLASVVLTPSAFQTEDVKARGRGEDGGTGGRIVQSVPSRNSFYPKNLI